MEYRASLMTRTERDGYAQLLIDKMRIAAMRGDSIAAGRLRVTALELSPVIYRREMENDD